MQWVLKHFNELNSNEVYDILALRNEVFVVEQTCYYLDIDGNDKDAYHIFACENEEIVAYARILKKGVTYSDASIGRVVVRKEYRKQKIASEMMKRALYFIKEELGESVVTIGAQAHLVDFYGSFGFKPISEVYLEDDIPHIDMTCKM